MSLYDSIRVTGVGEQPFSFTRWLDAKGDALMKDDKSDLTEDLNTEFIYRRASGKRITRRRQVKPPVQN